MSEEKKAANYLPLIALIAVAAIAGFAINYRVGGGKLVWMHYFMGILLCQFSLLKLFDIPGFADGFEMYDLIAKRSRIYAYAYPFIELILGLAFLSITWPIVTYSATVILMAVGSAGVMKALNEGLDIDCPCMGSVLEVPLSTVTLTEDLGMGFMALAMLISRYV